MHILEDPSGLSARAQAFLRRAARREPPVRFTSPIELWRVRDRTGRPVPAPMRLIIRCEGFEQRYGGLRYQVRHSWAIGGERGETAYGWEYDHLGPSTRAWQDPRGEGWYFEWTGQRVSKPCRDLLHTDGSVGTDIDGSRPYLRLAPSVPHLIESHALTDAVAAWTPWPTDALDAAAAAGLLTGLADVPEASWNTTRWRLSDTVAVRESDSWDPENPHRRTNIWSHGEAAHREVRAALDHVRRC